MVFLFWSRRWKLPVSQELAQISETLESPQKVKITEEKEKNKIHPLYSSIVLINCIYFYIFAWVIVYILVDRPLGACSSVEVTESLEVTSYRAGEGQLPQWDSREFKITSRLQIAKVLLTIVFLLANPLTHSLFLIGITIIQYLVRVLIPWSSYIGASKEQRTFWLGDMHLLQNYPNTWEKTKPWDKIMLKIWIWIRHYHWRP